MYPGDPRAGADRAGSASSSERSFYPVLGQHQNSRQHPVPPRPPPPPPAAPASASSASGASQNPLLRVQIAEPYRTMPPVLLRLGLEQIARTQVTFDFDLERRVLCEDAATSSGGNGAAAAPQLQTIDDPWQLVLERYTQMGYEREEAAMALAAYDGQEEQGQVVEFCRNYRQLRSMGFAPETAAGALMRHRDDLAAATDACLSAQG